jgi:hypothetical protein
MKQKNTWAIPLLILAGAGIVAAAILWFLPLSVQGESCGSVARPNHAIVSTNELLKSMQGEQVHGSWAVRCDNKISDRKQLMFIIGGASLFVAVASVVALKIGPGVGR